MPWRGPRTAASLDPLLHTRWWRVTVRDHFKRLGLPCAVCGVAIDYSGPRYFVLRNGRRKQNPRALVVGHVVSRYAAKLAGWDEARINSLSNVRQECQKCSNTSGARLGQRVQQAKLEQVRPRVLDESRRW